MLTHFLVSEVKVFSDDLSDWIELSTLITTGSLKLCSLIAYCVLTIATWLVCSTIVLFSRNMQI